MAGLNAQGKFGAPPANPEEEATFAGEWNNFFTKLKTDPTMQQAMLSFAAQVSNPEYGGNTVHAVADSANSAIGGYRATKAAQANAQYEGQRTAVKDQQTAEKHKSDLGKTAAEIGAMSVDSKLKGSQANRTEGGVDLDKSQAELNRAKALREAEEAKHAGAGASAKLTNQDKIAKALMAKNPELTEADAYLEAEQIAKSPSQTKLIMDFINSQGFIYGDKLPEKVKEVVGLSGGGGLQTQSGTPQGATPSLNPTLGVTPAPVDMRELRALADAYTAKGGSPISEAQLVLISKNPAQIMQLKQHATGVPNAQ